MKLDKFDVIIISLIFIAGFAAGACFNQCIIHEDVEVPEFILRDNGAMYSHSKEGLEAALNDLNNSGGGTIILPDDSDLLHFKIPE